MAEERSPQAAADSRVFHRSGTERPFCLLDTPLWEVQRLKQQQARTLQTAGVCALNAATQRA